MRSEVEAKVLTIIQHLLAVSFGYSEINDHGWTLQVLELLTDYVAAIGKWRHSVRIDWWAKSAEEEGYLIPWCQTVLR